MRHLYRSAPLVFLFILVLSPCGIGIALADENSGLMGWGKGSEYNRYYDVAEFDEFKGNVEDIVETTPLPGMAPGVGLVVLDQDGDKVNVQLGPKAFVKVDSIGLKKGDKIKVKGVWVEIDGKEIFMASKLKKGENAELKVRRTKDGTPYWTLSPEEIAAEKE